MIDFKLESAAMECADANTGPDHEKRPDWQASAIHRLVRDVFRAGARWREANPKPADVSTINPPPDQF